MYRRRISVSMAPAWVFLLVLSAAQPSFGERPMTVEDLWSMDRVGAPAVSPDGRLAVFTVTRYSMEDNRGNSDLWMVPTDGSRPPERLTWNPDADRSPRWSPDGTRIAFLSKRGEDAPTQLYVLPADGGEAEPVTRLPVSVMDFRWMPDGRRWIIAVSTWPDLNDDFEGVKRRVEERKKDPVQARITETRLVRYWDHYLTDGQADHFFLVDPRAGEPRDLMPGSTRLLPFWSLEGQWDVSPDGRSVVFAANSTDPPYRTLNFDLYLLDLDGGSARNLTPDNPAFDTSPRFSHDGSFVLYARNARPAYPPDFSRLYRLDLETGGLRALASSLDAEPSGTVLSPDDATVYFHAQQEGRRHLYAASARRDGPVRRLVAGGVTRGVDAGAEGTLVLTLESLLRPAELVSWRGGEMRRLTSFNNARLEALDLGQVEDFRFEGASGETVQMFVLYPPGFTKDLRWPLLHLVHGGPHGAWLDGFHYRWNAALFASRGAVVAAVNFHGSTGFGQAFAESIVGAHGDKPYTDIMRATDFLVEKGFVDPRRMAAAGGSYGGYLVSWILGHTDRFAALVNHAGVYDLMAQFASDWTWGRPTHYGAAPWEDPERIDRWSPSRFAMHFKTPTLVIHGEKDYRVPYTQGLNLYGVLQGKGVPSRLVIFPEENHWVLKPKSAVVWWREVFQWLDRYIGFGPTGAGDVEIVPAGRSPRARHAR